MRIHRRLDHLSKHTPRFFGFDSFTGFGDIGHGDKHPFYIDKRFSVDREKVMRNIRAKSK